MTVHLHTVLQRRTAAGPLRRLELTLPAGATLGDLLRSLEIALTGDAILLVVNGRQADAGRALANGDEIHLIPALSGGAPGGGEGGLAEPPVPRPPARTPPRS